MTKVEILNRIEIDGRVWQGSRQYVVTDAELERLIDAGAVRIETAAYDAAPENKAAPKRRGRPRKVQE